MLTLRPSSGGLQVSTMRTHSILCLCLSLALGSHARAQSLANSGIQLNIDQQGRTFSVIDRSTAIARSASAGPGSVDLVGGIGEGFAVVEDPANRSIYTWRIGDTSWTSRTFATQVNRLFLTQNYCLFIDQSGSATTLHFWCSSYGWDSADCSDGFVLGATFAVGVRRTVASGGQLLLRGMSCFAPSSSATAPSGVYQEVGGNGVGTRSVVCITITGPQSNQETILFYSDTNGWSSQTSSGLGVGANPAIASAGDAHVLIKQFNPVTGMPGLYVATRLGGIQYLQSDALGLVVASSRACGVAAWKSIGSNGTVVHMMGYSDLRGAENVNAFVADQQVALNVSALPEIGTCSFSTASSSRLRSYCRYAGWQPENGPLSCPGHAPRAIPQGLSSVSFAGVPDGDYTQSPLVMSGGRVVVRGRVANGLLHNRAPSGTAFIAIEFVPPVDYLTIHGQFFSGAARPILVPGGEMASTSSTWTFRQGEADQVAQYAHVNSCGECAVEVASLEFGDELDVRVSGGSVALDVLSPSTPGGTVFLLFSLASRPHQALDMFSGGLDRKLMLAADGLFSAMAVGAVPGPLLADNNGRAGTIIHVPPGLTGLQVATASLSFAFDGVGMTLDRVATTRWFTLP